MKYRSELTGHVMRSPMERGKSATVLLKWALDEGSEWVQHMLRRGC